MKGEIMEMIMNLLILSSVINIFLFISVFVSSGETRKTVLKYFSINFLFGVFLVYLVVKNNH